MISRRRRGLEPWGPGRPKIRDGKSVTAIIPEFYLTALEGLTLADKIRYACRTLYELRTGEKVNEETELRPPRPVGGLGDAPIPKRERRNETPQIRELRIGAFLSEIYRDSIPVCTWF